MRLYSYIKGTSIFLLFLVPLILLYNYYDRLEQRTEIILRDNIKEQLLNEMDKFQDDLKPENFVKSAFQDLEKMFNFPDLNNTQNEYTLTNDELPDFIGKDFIVKSKKFLKEKYGFEPFIFVSSGFDFTNLNIDDRDSILPNDEEKNGFLYSCIKAIFDEKFNLKKKDNISSTGLKACIANNNQILKEIFDNTFKKDLELYVSRYISIFYKGKILIKPGICIYYFSNVFGNQNIYNYYNLFFKNNKNFYNFLGFYFVFIKSSDFNIDKIIEHATKKSSNFKRKIINKGVLSPTWDFSGSSFIYKAPFSFYFYNYIEKQQSKSEDIYMKYNDYLRNHSLEISVDKSFKKNNYYIYKYSIIILIFIVIFIFILFLFNNIFNLVKHNLSLSIKIKLIVLIAVSIPMMGLFVIINITKQNIDKVYISNVEKKMQERILLFDKLKEDTFNNFTFDLLEHKKILADAYFENTPEHFFKIYNEDSKNISESEKEKAKKVINKAFQTGKNLSYYIISYFYLLDTFGNFLDFERKDFLGKKKPFKDYFHLYRYLNDMNLLNLNTKANKDNQTQFVFISSFIDSLFKTSYSNNELAKESQIISCEGLDKFRKVIYQLLASSSNPNLPKVLVYNWFRLNNIMNYKLNGLLVEKYSNLLKQDFEQVQIRYAIFERDSDEFFEKIPQPKVNPFYKLQKDSANLAIQKKMSGREIIEKDNHYFLKVWKYYMDNPIIFVGVAIIPKSKPSFVSIKMISLILLLYSILVVILLSDFLSKALLEPIKSFIEFVKKVSLGFINVKINIETGDELEKLGFSFNKMSEGLCEREKLKRFVSDKLVNSLEENNEQKIIKTKVTILSSDIRSFTTISEKNSPEDVVSLLNDYFTIMEKSIVKYGGSIEKIVGDAISAAFYEENIKEYALNACKAALEMRNSLKIFNKERNIKGLFTIENGIGISSGEVLTGFAGEKARRREFLLIGSILKQAENLEAMTKNAISSKVFIDKQTFEQVKDSFDFCNDKKDSDIFYMEIKL